MHRRIKFTPVVQGKIEAYLRDDLSPEQVTGVMRRQVEATVSHERIYQAVYVDYRRAGGGKPLQATCASAERSAGSDSDGRIGAEAFRTASALKNLRQLWRNAFITETGKSI